MAKEIPPGIGQQEQKAHIWQFVVEHEGFFCDPPPEGLGFPRPGMIPGALPEKAGGVAPGQDQSPEAETGEAAPGRDRRPHRIHGHGPRDPHAPGPDPAARPAGPRSGRHSRATRRDRGRRPKCSGSGKGCLRTGRPGTLTPAGGCRIPEELGKVLATGVHQWKRKWKIAECSLRWRPWPHRTGDTASCATLRPGPCTRSAPAAEISAATPVSLTCPRSW